MPASYDYDIVVIGSGPAGQAVASELRSSGLRLAMVEGREYGGTCPLRGCDAALAGSKVLILQRGPRPLKGFDPDLVQILVRASGKIGVEVHPNLPVRSVERRAKRFVIRAGEKGEHSLEADLVVHGAGRVPDIQRLDLEKGGVESSPRGVLVNEHLQSVCNPSVYAAGDAAATPYPLTPTANLEGKIVARNILSGNTVRADTRGVPSVVFTFPPLASVGLGEEELRRRGIEYEKKFAETSSWFGSRRIGLEDSGMKILAEKNSRRILGVHLLGHHAEEVINVFALALRLGPTTDDLGQIPWVYPSSVSEMGYLIG